MSREERMYIVEDVVDKRIFKGKVQYLIKWMDYGVKHNSWEPEENLGEIRDLIQDFERTWKRKHKRRARRRAMKKRLRRSYNNRESAAVAGPSSPRAENSQNLSEPLAPQETGFDLGLTPEEIMRASTDDDKLQFLMKWKEQEQMTLVPAHVAKEKCPELVIGFYEGCIAWRSSSSTASENAPATSTTATTATTE